MYQCSSKMITHINPDARNVKDLNWVLVVPGLVPKKFDHISNHTNTNTNTNANTKILTQIQNTKDGVLVVPRLVLGKVDHV